MRRYGAERAAAEAAAVYVDRVLYHLPCRNRAAVAVARMRGTFVGQVERAVELLARERGIGRRDHDIAPAHGLDERRQALHHIAQRLYLDEVVAEGAAVVTTPLERVEPHRGRGVESRDIIPVGHERHLPYAAQQLRVIAVVHGARHLGHDLLAHAVHQQIGAAGRKDRLSEAVAPIVVMGQAAQRRLDTADYHRRMRKKAFQNMRIGIHRTVGAESRRAAGRVCVVAAQAQVGRIVVDHRIHSSGRHAEEQTGLAQLRKVAQIVAPVGLRHDRNAIALGFEQAAYDGGTECRVVDICVAREQDDVSPVPAALAHLLDCRR